MLNLKISPNLWR